MPRRGWTAMEVPSGWYEVIRGLRLPSVRWPQAQYRQSSRGQVQSERRGEKVSFPDARRGRWRNPPQGPVTRRNSAESVRPRLTPAQVASEASTKVALLSPDDTAELKSLQVALAKARAQTVLPHPAKQVEDCEEYCTGAKRRLEKAREAAKAAQEAVARFEQELQEGLQRLEELRVAAAPLHVNPGTVDPPPTLPADIVAEVNQLRAAVQALTRERDDLRADRSAEGQPTQTVLALGSLENRNASNVMATLIEEADTDLSEKSRSDSHHTDNTFSERSEVWPERGASGRTGPPRSSSEAAGPHQGPLNPKFTR